MKTHAKKTAPYLFPVAFVCICMITGFSSLRHVSPEQTQTPPQGMVLVQSDSVRPFYISVIEEPNINWQAYVAWQKAIFFSYQDVYKASLPRDTMTGLWQYYNDPLLDAYFEHPAYQWYPVTGVSWLQVREYMEWKTDRLNEMILDKTNIHPYISWKMGDDNNFNTEAYLTGQYEAPSRKRRKGQPKGPDGYGRNVEAADGILFPQYRLPTEEEWELTSQYTKNPLNLGRIKSSLKKGNFLDYWIHHYNLNPGYSSYHGSGKSGNITNFPSGISEWLLDNETYQWKAQYGTVDILLENGWSNSPDKNHLELLGDIKDSIGKMPLRWVETGTAGPDIFLYPPKAYDYEYQAYYYPNIYYQKDSMFMDSILRIRYGYTTSQNRNYFKQYLEYYHINPLAMTKDSLEKGVLKLPAKDNRNIKRKIKTGNFKQAGAGISWIAQDASSPFVGFRCVLPYMAIPVMKKYKVKW